MRVENLNCDEYKNAKRPAGCSPAEDCMAQNKPSQTGVTQHDIRVPTTPCIHTHLTSNSSGLVLRDWFVVDQAQRGQTAQAHTTCSAWAGHTSGTRLNRDGGKPMLGVTMVIEL
mgnify:CR=1 FL=1